MSGLPASGETYIIDKKGNHKNKNNASTLTGGAHSGGNHSDMDLIVKISEATKTGMQQHTLQAGSIRRLTPTECERLQGFPDGWTKEGAIHYGPRKMKGGPSAESMTKIFPISDTQRYKTLGNAVTVNVIKAIMEKLL